MVAVFPEPENQQNSRTPLFEYLKPYSPTPSVTDNSSDVLVTVPCAQPPHVNKGHKRLLSILCGAAQATAIGLGLWMPSLSDQPPTPVEMATSPQTDDALWNYLASDELAEVQLAAKEKQINEKLAQAEQARLQAQQTRLEAEAQAKILTEQAAQQARETSLDAMRRADIVALDATYIGAEQVLYAEAGDDITLKFAARIQCKDGSFGETAVAAPVDSRITPREIRNLVACYPSPETAAGGAIGQAGEWGVAFFKMEQSLKRR
jgi:hypothetical protein